MEGERVGGVQKSGKVKKRTFIQSVPGHRAALGDGRRANAMVTGLARVVVVASSSRGRGARGGRGGGRGRGHGRGRGREGRRGRDSADSRPVRETVRTRESSRATESFAGVDEVVVERNLRAVSDVARALRRHGEASRLSAAAGASYEGDGFRLVRCMPHLKRREADAAVSAGRVLVNGELVRPSLARRRRTPPSRHSVQSARRAGTRARYSCRDLHRCCDRVARAQKERVCATFPADVPLTKRKLRGSTAPR